MYNLSIPPQLFKSFSEALLKSPSVEERLKCMCETPLTGAVRTNLELLGDYYINAGRWCILFNINEEEKVVEITGIRSSHGLYNIMKSFVNS